MRCLRTVKNAWSRNSSRLGRLEHRHRLAAQPGVLERLVQQRRRARQAARHQQLVDRLGHQLARALPEIRGVGLLQAQQQQLDLQLRRAAGGRRGGLRCHATAPSLGVSHTRSSEISRAVSTGLVM